jgi:acyl carrier protein
MRTNQMNCTTIRRSESDLRDLLRAGGGEILTVEVSDRFGSYGLTGAVVFRSRGDALEVDTFLLSCRVLGRGVEHRLLAHVGELAAERGLNDVRIAYAPTARNKPALAFLSSLGAAHETAAEGGLLFRLPVELARNVRIRDSAPAPAPAAAPRQAEQRQVSPDTPDYLRIARALRTAEAILAEMKKRRARPAAFPAGSEPRTELEARLAAIWAELLRVQHVGIHDNFFDLGGHSLAAVQLLSQVRQEFGVEVTLEVVYGGAFTVAELAKAIELREIEQAPGGDFDSLMAEIEELSEEEARALLEKEQQG